MKSGVEIIAEERQRQITEEGYTAEHDDKHEWGELWAAAACYLKAHRSSNIVAPLAWPWGMAEWKPKDDNVRNLACAGALIAAEIDRLNRLQK